MGDLRAILPPVRYRDVKEKDFSAHLKHIVNNFQDKDRAEIYLETCDVSIPCSMRPYAKGPMSICLLLRSGDFGLENLENLLLWLREEGYKTQIRRSSRRKQLTSVTVILDSVDKWGSVKSIRLLKEIRSLFKEEHETVTIAYYGKNDTPGLPGRKEYSSKLEEAGYRIGKAVGRFVGKVF